jgi:hypothetical protein
MGFKKAILNIRIYNYHNLLWGKSLINKFFLHQSPHIFYCLVMNLSYQASLNKM